MDLGNEWTNVTFEDLVPGRQYTLEMAAVAGPYRSSVRSATDWTCESDAPPSILLQNASNESRKLMAWKQGRVWTMCREAGGPRGRDTQTYKERKEKQSHI